MLLSVPLTVTIKILLERSAVWGWVAILLDSGENLPAVTQRAIEDDPEELPGPAGLDAPSLDRP